MGRGGSKYGADDYVKLEYLCVEVEDAAGYGTSVPGIAWPPPLRQDEMVSGNHWGRPWLVKILLTLFSLRQPL